MQSIRDFGLIPSFVLAAGLGVCALYVYLLGSSTVASGWDTWLALLIAPALLLAAVPLGRRLAVVSGDPMLTRIVVIAAAAKLAGTGVRYLFVFDVYGRGDSVAYARAGARYAQQLSDGYLTLPDGDLVGTRFIELVTGFVFAVTRPATLTGFIIFSFAGFVGLYHFARAFNIALPQANLRTYALLVFFLPSLLFWPSSIGKESWMMLTLGLAARGTALILARRRGGLRLSGRRGGWGGHGPTAHRPAGDRRVGWGAPIVGA